MVNRGSRRRGIAAALLLVVSSSGVVSGQAEVEPASPDSSVTPGAGIAEVALCRLPELGEEVGSVGPDIASIVPVALERSTTVAVEAPQSGSADGMYGCRFETTTMPHPVTGQDTPTVLFPGTSMASPHVAGAWAMRSELTRQQARRFLGRDGVAFVGRRQDFPGGPYTVIGIDHTELPPDVGVNIQTTFDRRPFNDAPLGIDGPGSPLFGDGLYSVFAGDGGPRALSTEWPDTYYQGNQPFAATMTPTQTTFLIPPAGVGPTFTPFIFADGTYHTIDILPNGQLPVNGLVPLQPECMSQFVLHQPLVYEGLQASNSSDIVAACFRLSGMSLQVASDLLGSGGMGELVRVTFDSYDPESRSARQQTTLGTVRLDGDRLYIAFPSGLLQYGFHRVTNVSFEPLLDGSLDGLLRAAGETFTQYLAGIAVTAPEGLRQGTSECVPNGDVPLSG